MNCYTGWKGLIAELNTIQSSGTCCSVSDVKDCACVAWADIEMITSTPHVKLLRTLLVVIQAAASLAVSVGSYAQYYAKHSA